VVGTLLDCLVVAGVVFVHGDEQLHVLEVHCQFAHVDELIFLGVVAGHVEVVEPLDQHALDVSERFPDIGLAQVELIVHVPGPIEALEFDKDIENILLFELV
jgi:hypothetical protein